MVHKKKDRKLFIWRVFLLLVNEKAYMERHREVGETRLVDPTGISAQRTVIT